MAVVAPTQPPRDAASRSLVAALTTEHFTLQTARSATIFESGSRASLFLSTVSSALVALALIGQVSRLGDTFILFALILVPTLFALGVLTYLRLNESAAEDAFYARAANRIRGYYRDLDASASEYLLLSDHDDLAGAMVLVVTALLGGVSLSLVMSVLGASLVVAAAPGGALALVLAIAGFLHHARSFERADRRVPVRFPSS